MPAVTHKERQSNFEALRIVAMAMIVATHYCGHGVQHVGENPELFAQFLEGSLSHRLITMFFNPAGDVGVAVFFMLTGFFMCQSEWKPVRLKRLATQALFYSLLTFIARNVIWGGGA